MTNFDVLVIGFNKFHMAITYIRKYVSKCFGKPKIT